MRITKKTKTRDVLPLLNGERLAEIIEKIPRQPLPVPVTKMSVGQFLEASECGYTMDLLKEKKAYIAFGRIAQLKDEMQAVSKYLERYKVPTSKEVEEASRGIVFPSWQERTLCDLVAYYHLHSTKEAEALPVTDWLLMVKDNATSAMVRYNMAEIERRKAKGGKQ